MRFSIVAPCLNEQRHLRVFLDSLKMQTFKDFELIIVDGFSEDRGREIIKQYARFMSIFFLQDATRNFGYIRCLGAGVASGEILFHGSVDTYLEPRLLEKLDQFYREHPEVVSVAGRTYPMGTSIIAHLAYQAFDFLRFIFTCAPMPIKKYRPSGNFTTVKRNVYRRVGGHPHVTVNEDGLLGQKLDELAASNHKRVAFRLDLYVGHHVKKFESMGGIRAVMFYFYTLSNLFPFLKPLLKHVEIKAGKVFENV